MKLFVTVVVVCSLALLASSMKFATTPSNASKPPPCSTITNCSGCAERDDCLWCEMGNWTYSKKCVDIAVAETQNCSQTGWCNADSCGCGFFPVSNNMKNMIVMMLIYGSILLISAKFIGDGSEELLELFPNYGTIIGALLLPVLGAFPDSVMVIMSGLGSSAEAQEQVSVGMGTLAGSTVMLLTLPWAVSLILARTDLVRGRSVDGQRNISFLNGLFSTGASVDEDTMWNARIAIFSSVTYLFLQPVAFMYLKNPEDAGAKALERKLALAGAITCFAGFLAYCLYQIIVPKLAEKRKEKAIELAEIKKMQARATLVVKRMHEKANIILRHQDEESANLARQDHANARALAFGKKWLRKAKEAKAAREGLSEVSPLINRAESAMERIERSPSKKVTPVEIAQEIEAAEEEHEEKNFWSDLGTSIAYLVVGVFLVVVFSDPMVDVISQFGVFTGIPAFYVSFIITPLCSNASEVVASIMFAAKMTVTSSSMTFSQLYGAATMNNTLVLGVFYALIYIQGLAWEFSAETVTILFVTLVVCIFGALKDTYTLFWAIPNVLLYPAALLIVYLLENFLGWK